MNLYYEDVPAGAGEVPQLPPLLHTEKVAQDADVMAKAIGRAGSGEVGLVCYAERQDVMDIAITLAPEVPGYQAEQMHFTAMNAVGDAVGALAPPEVGVRYRYPGDILFNRGRAGSVRLATAHIEDRHTDIPAWMVASIQIRLNFKQEFQDRDFQMDNTSLSEEGGSFISCTRLIESTCRHFLVWLHQWEEEGFQPVHDNWLKRCDDSKVLHTISGETVEFVGLDENGNALISQEKNVRAVDIYEAGKLFGRHSVE